MVFFLMGCGSDSSVDTEPASQSSQYEPSIEMPDADGSNILPIKPGKNEASAFDLVTESNLFSSDRSFSDSDSGKTVEPTPAPKQPAVELDSLKLVGTISTDQEEMFAFIINKKDAEKKGKTQRVALGDKIGEYTLEEIKKDRVVLRNGDSLSVVLLKPSERAQGGGKPGGADKTGKESGKRQPSAQASRPAFERPKEPAVASSGKASSSPDRSATQVDRSAGRQMEDMGSDQKPDNANDMQKEKEPAPSSPASSICGGDSYPSGESQMCGR